MDTSVIHSNGTQHQWVKVVSQGDHCRLIDLIKCLDLFGVHNIIFRTIRKDSA